MTQERNLKTEWHRILVTGVSGPYRKLIEKKSRIRWVENSKNKNTLVGAEGKIGSAAPGHFNS